MNKDTNIKVYAIQIYFLEILFGGSLKNKPLSRITHLKKSFLCGRKIIIGK